MPNEFIYERAKVYFSILDSFKLEYAVFAGQSIGMIRNGRNIPWVDDYDIMIFTSSIIKFEKEIKPVLENNGYSISTLKFNPYDKIQSNLINSNQLNQIKKIKNFVIFGYQITYKSENSTVFLCDIFISHKSDKLEGINKSWGIYNRGNIPITSALPFVRKKFDNDLYLPFFNNMNNEVELTYGSIKSCTIYTHSRKWRIKYDNWEDAYNDFNCIKNMAILNTKNKININKNYKGINNLTIPIKNNFNKDYDILIYLNTNNIGKIFIHNNEFLIKYVMVIKYYFPNMKIEFFSYDTNIKTIPFLNHVNILHVKNEYIYNYYNNSKFIYLNKPKIDFIKLITFGTFDLFHIGHQKIFERCLKYSDYIVVGISSDEFTFNKKQIIPTDNFETRQKNVYNCKNVKKVFSEESLELKNDYIKEYNANILIMGDDWKDKFNWVDCSVIYLERTPDISSTMLRNIAQNNKN